MKFTEKFVTAPKEILYNDHYVATVIKFGKSSADENGIVKAGTIVPANDATALGVVLYDVNINENPNGAVVVHGFINSDKLPVQPSEEAKTALKQITFSVEV